VLDVANNSNKFNTSNNINSNNRNNTAAGGSSSAMHLSPALHHILRLPLHALTAQTGS
jgi:hypothetical protein